MLRFDSENLGKVKMPIVFVFLFFFRNRGRTSANVDKFNSAENYGICRSDLGCQKLLCIET